MLDDPRQGLRSAHVDDAALISPDADHAVALDDVHVEQQLPAVDDLAQRRARGAPSAPGGGRSAVRSEWRLLAATHNLLKLHRHQLATA